MAGKAIELKDTVGSYFRLVGARLEQPCFENLTSDTWRFVRRGELKVSLKHAVTNKKFGSFPNIVEKDIKSGVPLRQGSNLKYLGYYSNVGITKRAGKIVSLSIGCKRFKGADLKKILDWLK